MLSTLGLLVAVAVVQAQEPSTDMARCGARAMALPGALDDAKSSVVRIETTLGHGSGVFISPDGFVLTAAHVVGQARKVKVVLEDESVLDAVVTRTSIESDVALVRVSVGTTPCLPLATERAGSGTDLFIVGSPIDEALTHSVSRGIVSAYRDADGRVFLQTDASINAGNSGGPILDAAGYVAGVVSFKAVGVGVEGLGFGLAAESVEDALGFTRADSTAADFAVRIDEGGSDSSGEPSAPVIEGRPSAPALINVKSKWCEKWVVDESDAFTGDRVIKAPQPYGGQYGYNIEISEDDISFSWLVWLVEVPVEKEQADDIIARLAFEDGTRVTLTSRNTSVGATPYGGPFWKYEFGITPEVVEVLGTSPWKAARIEYPSGRTADLVPRAAGDLSYHGSCLASMIAAGDVP